MTPHQWGKRKRQNEEWGNEKDHSTSTAKLTNVYFDSSKKRGGSYCNANILHYIRVRYDVGFVRCDVPWT